MRKVIWLFMLLTLASCASAPLEIAKNAKEAYERGERLVMIENYNEAARSLEKFSATYPYSKYATPAELLRLKAAYLDGQYILSETLGLRFINAHPDHEGRVYAQYLVAMSYYKQSSSAKLDQQFSHRSRDAFLVLNSDFPNNPYSHDIQTYLDILTNRVAEHEMLVGKFYFDKRMYVAASNRLLKVKNEYSNATITAEALYYLTSAYVLLQQDTFAKEISVLLEKKYAETIWYKKSLQLL